MGVPTTGGARGSITVDTSQLASARANVNAFAGQINAAFGGVNATVAKTQSSFAGLSGSIRQVAGAFGLSLGIAGVVQLGKAAIAATELATAYGRQGVAARNLAGGQAQLNKLLETYANASGGAVDKATALANVTKLMSVGFADNNKEIEQFTRAIRGISIAMGTSQDTVTQNLILELFTQRGARLDQLGLQYDKVRQRADELAAADSSLTAKQAYQNAVLEQATERFGALADSAEGQATGVEKARTAWSNLGLTLGQLLSGPINSIASGLTFWINDEIVKINTFIAVLKAAQTEMRKLGIIAPDFSGTSLASRTSIGRVTPQAFGGIGAEEKAIHLDWARGVNEVNDQLHDDIIDEETSFGASRAKTVADYSKGVARDEAAFGRSRLRANLDQLDAIAGVLRDASRREAGQAADFARTQATTRADAAERAVDARKDAAKRLAELDENYEKDRLKRASDLSDKLLDAAGELDAKQVYELQRDAAKQQQEASDAHDDARKKITDGLDERLEDEAKALAKSLRQQQEAYERQLSEGRENDKLRLEDMRTAFDKQQARAKEDHDIQVGERAADQAAQLAEMDTQHGLRLNQIRTHAIEERNALQEAADAALVAAGVADEATRKRHEAQELAEEKLWDKFHKHITDSLTPRTLSGGPVQAYAAGGYVPSTGLAMLHRGEYVMPAAQVARTGTGGGSSRVVNIHPGAVVVYAAAGQDEDRIADRVVEKFIDRLEAGTP